MYCIRLQINKHVCLSMADHEFVFTCKGTCSRLKKKKVRIIVIPTSVSTRTVEFSSPEAALLLVNTKNRDLWPSQRSNDWAFA